MHLYKTGGKRYILSSSHIRQADCLATLDHATDAQAKMMVAAPELLAALEKADCPVWVHNAATTNEIEALRAIALWYADWNNEIRIDALAKAKGE